MSKSIAVFCPHCNRRTHVKSRKSPSLLLTKLIVNCPNPDCLASFEVMLEITRAIHPSLAPSNTVADQLTEQRRRELLKAPV